MRLVDRPAFKPFHCAAIPFMGQTKEGVRWVDTGVEMAGFDQHIYLSDVAISQAAALLGYPTPEEQAALVTELHDTMLELQAALDSLAALEKYRAAVEEIQNGHPLIKA